MNYRFTGPVAVLLLLAGLAACSSDKTTSSTGVPSAMNTNSAPSSTASSVTTSSARPTVSGTPTAAVVRDGLLKISQLAGQIVATSTTSPAEAKTQAEGIEPLWSPIEDIVKANDPNAYLALEDSFALLESGDISKIAQGAGRASSTVSTYLAKYPG